MGTPMLVASAKWTAIQGEAYSPSSWNSMGPRPLVSSLQQVSKTHWNFGVRDWTSPSCTTCLHLRPKASKSLMTNETRTGHRCLSMALQAFGARPWSSVTGWLCSILWRLVAV